ncbi:MAG TPA: hypothetical protein VJV79_21415 [Polyangiaceae bacterium]|nr:hypothetical protein [Polyangiaceae bacterium]
MRTEPTAGDTDQEPGCKGCLVGEDCIADGVRNPSNLCQICNAGLVGDAYSPNTGAKCGSGATECSGQDTCDANAVCQKNDLEVGTSCAAGVCEAGVCQAIPNPFDCIAPNPPKTDFTAEVFGLAGTPPAAKGGVVADGRYTATRIDLYGSAPTGVDLRTFEFKKGFVQIASRYYTVDTKIAYIPEIQFSGSFTGSANSLKFNLERCDPQYDIDVPNLPYTATANGLITFLTLSDGATVVTSYSRQ